MSAFEQHSISIQKKRFAQEEHISGRYEILNCLGSGSMGSVYLVADHWQDGKLMALKLLHPNHASNPSLLPSFLREISFLSSVKHPNVVDLWAVGGEGDLIYHCTEYLDGINLESLLVSENLTFETILKIFTQLCCGVAAIH